MILKIRRMAEMTNPVFPAASCYWTVTIVILNSRTGYPLPCTHSPLEKVPIRPPARRKGKKRPNLFQERRPTLHKASPHTGIHPDSLPPHRHKIRLPVPTKFGNPNVLNDTRGHPDLEHEYDIFDESIDYSSPSHRLIRKTLHELPTSIDPDFNVKFNEALHGEYLRSNLKLEHLHNKPNLQHRIINLVKKYWPIFDPHLYIHGPFNFAVSRGTRTRDRIGVEDWQVLRNAHSMYANDPPISDLRALHCSINYSSLFDTEFPTSQAIEDRLNEAPVLTAACFTDYIRQA